LINIIQKGFQKMRRLALNKSSLNYETSELKIYKKCLPSLDMKRRYLIRERNTATQQLEKTKKEIKSGQEIICRELPMVSNDRIDLTNLAHIKAVQLEDENVMGAELPKIRSIDIEIREYSFLAKPQWVDAVVLKLKTMLALHIRVQVEKHRLMILEKAVKKITQRVNLFEKVLIPKTEQNIKQIQIYLSDAERAAVVRAKIAKHKQTRAIEK